MSIPDGPRVLRVIPGLKGVDPLEARGGPPADGVVIATNGGATGDICVRGANAGAKLTGLVGPTGNCVVNKILALDNSKRDPHAYDLAVEVLDAFARMVLSGGEGEGSTPETKALS